MSKPVFDLYKLNQELISADTKIVHLNADIAELRQALSLVSARMKNRTERVGQLKEALGDLLLTLGPGFSHEETLEAALWAQKVLDDTYLEPEGE